MSDPTPERLAELRRLLDAAPGALSPIFAPFASHWEIGRITNHAAHQCDDHATVELACAAVNALPCLLLAAAERDRLRAQLDDATTQHACPECGEQIGWKFSGGNPGWYAVAHGHSPRLHGTEAFIGPCAHGRDPWDRCETCGEGDAFDAAVAALNALRAELTAATERAEKAERERDEARAAAACPACDGEGEVDNDFGGARCGRCEGSGSELDALRADLAWAERERDRSRAEADRRTREVGLRGGAQARLRDDLAAATARADALARRVEGLEGALATLATEADNAVAQANLCATGGATPAQPGPADPERAGAPVCGVCGDSHRMILGGRFVLCTHCPMPCDQCGNGGAYCRTTPCPCMCHRPTTEPR